jgi:hypothetical protein
LWNYANWKVGTPNGKEAKDEYCPHLDDNRQWALEECKTNFFYPLCQEGSKLYFS